MCLRIKRRELMEGTREWQGYWEGRESTRWIDSIKNLRKKIPTFKQEVFCIGAEVNKYKDLIVREPLSQVKGISDMRKLSLAGVYL
jgi:hypothetical protein